MPHKDRQTYLDYLRSYHARTRPQSAPEPQRDPALPPLGVILTEEDGSRIQCHVCGRWYGALPYHLTKLHGLNADAYKERYALNRGASLTSPQWQARQRARAIERGQGEIGRQHLPPGQPRPHGIIERTQGRINKHQRSGRRPATYPRQRSTYAEEQ